MRPLDDRREDRRSPESSSEAAPAAAPKKVYRKPELSRYERLHGIGLGSP